MLQYIAPKTVKSFGTIRADYEKEKKVSLKDRGFWGRPTLFGGANTPKRDAQVALLEKMQLTLEHYALSGQPTPWAATLMAVRTMIAACFYIQSEIGRSKDNSVLYRLINDYLRTSKENYFSEEDKGICFDTAVELLHTLEAINSQAQDKEYKFTSEEWGKLSAYFKEQKKIYNIVPDKYPITSILQPAFQEGFNWVGMTFGGTLAQAVNKSTLTTPIRVGLTSTIGSFLLFIGPTGSVLAISLAASTAATIALDYFFTVSLARTSGAALGTVGKGVGTAIGTLCDSILNLIWAAGSYVLSFVATTPHPAKIDGIRLDGRIMKNGQPIELQIVAQDKLPEGAKILQITDTGEICVDGKPVEDLELLPIVQGLAELLPKITKESIVEKIPENHLVAP